MNKIATIKNLKGITVSQVFNILLDGFQGYVNSKLNLSLKFTYTGVLDAVILSVPTIEEQQIMLVIVDKETIRIFENTGGILFPELVKFIEFQVVDAQSESK